ncbi:hypothetical protein M9458_015523, partial [Cirrhinus mrigala]
MVFNYLARLELQGKWGKEQTLPGAEYLFSLFGTGLGHYDCTPLTGSCTVGAEVHEITETQNSGSSRIFSEARGTYGTLSHGDAAGSDAPETSAALASYPNSEMAIAPRHTLCEHHISVLPYLQPLGRHFISMGRSALRTSVQMHRDHDRCFQNGLGHHVQQACGHR